MCLNTHRETTHFLEIPSRNTTVFDRSIEKHNVSLKISSRSNSFSWKPTEEPGIFLKRQREVKPFLGNPSRNPAGFGGPPESQAISWKFVEGQCMFHRLLVLLGHERARQFRVNQSVNNAFSMGTWLSWARGEPGDLMSHFGATLKPFWGHLGPPSPWHLGAISWGYLGAVLGPYAVQRPPCQNHDHLTRRTPFQSSPFIRSRRCWGPCFVPMSRPVVGPFWSLLIVGW